MVQWFVEPCGDVAHANKVFFDHIGPAEEFAKEIRDENGESREVWSCKNYDLVLRFWNSRTTLKIEFRVWNRRRNYGPIRDVTLLMPRTREKKSAPLAKAVDF